MALPQHLAEFERRVNSRLAEAVEEMRRSLQAKAESASSQLLSELESYRPEIPERLLEETELQHLERPSKEEARGEFARELKSVLAALDAAATQGEALDALLAGARPGDGRIALWITQPDALVGWGSAGFGGNGHDPLAGARLPWNLSPAIERLSRGRGTVRLGSSDTASFANELEVAAAGHAAFVPLVLRDRLAAALYVDSSASELELERIQLLAHATAQRLELQALSSRLYSPTLVLDDEAPAGSAGLPLWDAAEIAADAATGITETFASTAPVAVSFAAADVAYPVDDPPLSTGLALEAGEATAATIADRRARVGFDFEPGDTVIEPINVAELGLPALDAEPSERFVLQAEPAAFEPISPAPAAGIAESIDEPASAAEIAWELEETDATLKRETLEPLARVEPSVPATDDAATGQIPHAPPAAPPAFEPPSSHLREIRVDAPAFESTAEFVSPQPAPSTPVVPPPAFPSFAGTQPISTAGLATHEFPLPDSAPVEPPADLSDEATLLVRRDATPPLGASPTMAIPIAAPPAPTPPVAPPPSLAPTEVAPPAGIDDEPTVMKSKTTEVAPPPDVQGPGWAFTSSRAQRATGESALHEEARRLARLLISEIKLYNEEQVEEGRRNRDVYHRLKEDIDRSRQIYEERVHDSVRGTTDYFQQELVRSLAGGDARALGI